MTAQSPDHQQSAGMAHGWFSVGGGRLRVLRDEGLIARRRDGNHIYYALADRHVADLIRNALAHAGELNAAPVRPTPDGDD